MTRKSGLGRGLEALIPGAGFPGEQGILEVPLDQISQNPPQPRVRLALIENVQRADLNPLEMAEAYRQLGDEFGFTHEQIAERVAKSRVAVTNTLRLLKLPVKVKQALAEERISEGHARALLALPTPESQEAVLENIIRKDFTVRQTEDLVSKILGLK